MWLSKCTSNLENLPFTSPLIMEVALARKPLLKASVLSFMQTTNSTESQILHCRRTDMFIIQSFCFLLKERSQSTKCSAIHFSPCAFICQSSNITATVRCTNGNFLNCVRVHKYPHVSYLQIVYCIFVFWECYFVLRVLLCSESVIVLWECYCVLRVLLCSIVLLCSECVIVF
jgi:hypothetical protein